MKFRMVWKLVFFVTIFMLINGVASVYFYKVSIANHKLIQQEEIFDQSGPRIDWLIMGHSRPATAIDLTQISYGVQFCSGGESNIHTFYKLRHILEAGNKKVKRVVLPAGFGSFILPSQGINTNAFYWKKYVDYLRLGKELGAFWPHVGRLTKATFFPWFEYPYLRTAMVFGDFDLRIDKVGFMRGNEAERTAIAKKMYYQTMTSRSYYDALSLSYLERTIDLCHEHKLGVVFVKFPLTKAARAAENELSMEYGMTQYVEKVDSIINSYPEVQFLDFRSFFENEERLFFSDHHHLNNRGSVLFTEKLMESIREF